MIGAGRRLLMPTRGASMLPVLSPLAKGTLGHPLISRRRDLSEKWLGKYIGSNALDYSTGACFDTEVTQSQCIYILQTTGHVSLQLLIELTSIIAQNQTVV